MITNNVILTYNIRMQNVFLETERLILRQITQNDFDEIASMLKDKDVMYAWEYVFSDFEVKNWIEKNIENYNKYGLGYFITIDKKTNAVVGQTGLMIDIINGEKYYEISYMLNKKFWGKGYATEAAKELAQYALKNLSTNTVIFEIRPENTSSIKVAERLGAQVDGSFIKKVNGKDMKHLIYKLFMVN